MYLILIMAINSQPLIFKETKIFCSDITYTWERLYNMQVGIKTKTAEYVTQHVDIDALDLDIEKQCKSK